MEIFTVFLEFLVVFTVKTSIGLRVFGPKKPRNTRIRSLKNNFSTRMKIY
jgi:hypothetical protein